MGFKEFPRPLNIRNGGRTEKIHCRKGMDWQELSEKYGVSHTMIGKYRRKALKEMDVFYEIREKNDLEVMLS